VVVNKLYKNRYTLDVGFYPTHLVSESETSLTFEGGWYNINTSTPFTIGQDIIKVDKSQLDNWSELNVIQT
jgi:hypothetical protein